MSEHQYLNLLAKVLSEGVQRDDRTGTGTVSIFGAQMRFNLNEGFPLLTTKRVNMRAIIHELLWFLSGSTNIKYLVDNDVHIWDEWADKNGDLGPVYGAQWRSWKTIELIDPNGHPSYEHSTIDQIANVIRSIRTNPNSRRHIVTAWNPAEVDDMALPPCHCLFQFYVANGKLSCQLYQRSADMFLGVPFNIASYALLTHMVAHVCRLEPGEFIHTLGDAHLYSNHVEQAIRQHGRPPRKFPTLSFSRQITDIDDFKFENIIIDGYNPHPAISAPIAV